MPRRLLVDLPDAENSTTFATNDAILRRARVHVVTYSHHAGAKIIKVILRDEDVDDTVDPKACKRTFFLPRHTLTF